MGAPRHSINPFRRSLAAVSDGAQELVSRLLFGRLTHGHLGLEHARIAQLWRAGKGELSSKGCANWTKPARPADGSTADPHQDALLLCSRDGCVEALALIDKFELAARLVKVRKAAIAHNDLREGAG